MNVKKTFCIIFLFLILFSAMALVSADDDKSYSIDQAFVELTVGSNGLLHVDEIYDYTFHGTFNGVYRDIPLKEGESIDNITVNAKGAYPVVKESDENGKKHLKIYLYADEEHTQKISNTEVYIYISYDMKNTVTLFNDVAGLQYKLWGEDWDVGIDALTAVIHLPGNKNNVYFLNPQEYNSTSYLINNTISLTSNSIPSGEFYEVLVLMPLEDFDNNAPYAKHVNENGKENIIHNMESSVNERNFWNTSYIVLGLLSLISPIVAIIVYFRFGREPKVDYNGLYEREPPTDDSPAMVNALIDNAHDIGTPNMKGFEATILSLIDKKVFELETKRDANTDLTELFLKLNRNNTADLAIHENTVFDIMEMFSDSHDIVNLSNLNNDLSYEANAKLFMEEFREWQQDVKHEYLDTQNLETYFNSKGSKFMRIIGVGGLILGIIIFILGLFTNLHNGIYAIGGGIALAIFSFIVIMLPEDIFGQWTKKGRLFYLKWVNFKKFLKDNSLINEHPPESIVVWKQYLIYGTALGVADNVYKAMKLQEKNISDFNDDVFLYHHYGGYYMMHNAFITGESSANPSSDAGGFGGLGGGSGGGGGGAF